MLKNVWTHRFIWTLDSLVLGIIFDRLSPTPLWALFGMIVVAGSGYWLLGRPCPVMKRLGIDEETTATVRSVGLALVFFAGCAVAAGLIL